MAIASILYCGGCANRLASHPSFPDVASSWSIGNGAPSRIVLYAPHDPYGSVRALDATQPLRLDARDVAVVAGSFSYTEADAGSHVIALPSSEIAFYLQPEQTLFLQVATRNGRPVVEIVPERTARKALRSLHHARDDLNPLWVPEPAD